MKSRQKSSSSSPQLLRRLLKPDASLSLIGRWEFSGQTYSQLSLRHQSSSWLIIAESVIVGRALGERLLSVLNECTVPRARPGVHNSLIGVWLVLTPFPLDHPPAPHPATLVTTAN
eukprot:1185155-Prorocentrum_minimum.AAC.1